MKIVAEVGVCVNMKRRAIYYILSEGSIFSTARITIIIIKHAPPFIDYNYRGHFLFIIYWESIFPPQYPLQKNHSIRRSFINENGQG